VLVSGWLSVVRNLSGHRGAIRSIELYPFGEFAASTSADHNVKVCLRLFLKQSKNEVTQGGHYFVSVFVEYFFFIFVYSTVFCLSICVTVYLMYMYV